MKLFWLIFYVHVKRSNRWFIALSFLPSLFSTKSTQLCHIAKQKLSIKQNLGWIFFSSSCEGSGSGSDWRCRQIQCCMQRVLSQTQRNVCRNDSFYIYSLLDFFRFNLFLNHIYNNYLFSKPMKSIFFFLYKHFLNFWFINPFLFLFEFFSFFLLLITLHLHTVENIVLSQITSLLKMKRKRMIKQKKIKKKIDFFLLNRLKLTITEERNSNTC